MKGTRGYVYRGVLERGNLETLRELLGEGVTLSWNLGACDFSGALRERGCTFGTTWELRWRMLPDGRFAVLLLSEEPKPSLPLEAVSGTWETYEIPARLVPLHAPRFAPAFCEYPGLRSSEGTLVCRVYVRDGVTMFVSPRRFAP
uniref:Uncharacterized protein n=1 Tax=Candidatus Caldatribacterium saccharofermentans TaxID=1454753 RepID=A0A7V4TY18_9BACT